MKRLLKPSFNWLLIFVPLTVIVDQSMPTSSRLIFILACLAIVPLAALLSRATEQLATRSGDAIGGFLNAMFGNAAELIIGAVAIKEGEFLVAKAALIGGIIGNGLLVLGAAFLVGGVRHKRQDFNAEGARTQASTLAIASIALILPAAFVLVDKEGSAASLGRDLNIVVAGVLIAVYLLSLVFSLFTHRSVFSSAEKHGEAAAEHEGKPWPLSVAIVALVGASALIAVMSEILVGSVGEASEAMGMSDRFVGVVVLATVGGAAEMYAACMMASKNRMDLTIGIALGSSTLIALFVAPALFFLSLAIAPAPFDLLFAPGEVLMVLLTVLIMSNVVGDGHSTWFRGVQLLAVYALIAVGVYFGGEVLDSKQGETGQGSSEVTTSP